MTPKFLLSAFLLLFCGCKDVGFWQIDTSSRSRANVESARDVMSEIQKGIHGFYEVKHHYPYTNETHLYDSIRNYINPQLDPIYLYRNDNGKGYFIAVGGRGNRIIYRYPVTIGTGEYTLYWIGQNGVDEEGEGDDVDAWAPDTGRKRFERSRIAELENPAIQDRLILTTTGNDIFKDSALFSIVQGGSQVYADSWPLSAYFKNRPELTDAQRKQIVHLELQRFLTPGAFSHTDSLLMHDWGAWQEVNPKSPDMSDLIHSNELMFSYYAGDRGSKGIAWIPSKRKFGVIWKT